MKFYITFGQIHAHTFGNKRFDKDCLAEMEADNYGEAREKAMKLFDKKFHNCHDTEELPEIIGYYPRGIIKI